jgi:surface antigen
MSYSKISYSKAPTRGWLHSAAVVALLGGAMSLAGCETLERETGFNRHTLNGIGVGAAAGGIIAILAHANPAWIAASVVLGGATGGVIGSHLGRDDAERHARNNLSALDRLSEGQTESWSNSRTGNRGSTTVTRVTMHRDTSEVCKSYRETVHAGSETVTREGTACRPSGGTWRVV